jgi:hypothetical protein
MDKVTSEYAGVKLTEGKYFNDSTYINKQALA